MSITFGNSLSSTGTCVLTAPAATSVCWNLTFLSISFAGPSRGPNARVTIYDGAVGSTILFRAFLDQPTGSIGLIQQIALPQDQRGNVGLQALPGNAMNIVVDGYGANQCSINGRFTDGLP